MTAKVLFAIVLLQLPIMGCSGAPASTISADEHGNDGSAGEAGLTGEQGLAGPTGAMGEKGATGAPGATGAAGPQGPEGPAGKTGAAGMNGAMGQMGAMGAMGGQGPAGETGATGATGATGEAGAPGALSGKGSLYVVSQNFNTGGNTPAGGTVYCKSMTDIVVDGSCALVTSPPLGVTLTIEGAVNATTANAFAGWECAWSNPSSTPLFSTVTATCIAIP